MDAPEGSNVVPLSPRAAPCQGTHVDGDRLLRVRKLGMVLQMALDGYRLDGSTHVRKDFDEEDALYELADILVDELEALELGKQAEGEEA